MTELFELPYKLDFTIDTILLSISSLVMIITCIHLILSKSIIHSIVAMSIFSSFISISYLLMDAPDVAMTEVALGACLSTCVLLNIIKIVGDNPGRTSKTRIVLSTILCIIFMISLCLAALDLPQFGDRYSPVQTHLTQYYIENIEADIAIPSMVAGILASYRGFDTLGETAVILIAGLAAMIIISNKKEESC